MAGNNPYEQFGPSASASAAPAGGNPYAQFDQMGVPQQGSVPYDMNDPQPGGEISKRVIMGSSMYPRTEDKIKYLSNQSGLPINRFGVDNDGNIGYVGTKGGWYLIAPPIGGGSIKKPLDLANRVGGQIGSNLGQGPALVGGLVGGAYGGVPGAVGGAALGDTIRQGIAKLVMPESSFDPWNVAGQAAQAGTGQLAGELVGAGTNAMFGHNPLYLNAADAARVQRNLPAYYRNAAAGQDAGLSMTPGDITGLRSARVNERQLFKNPDAQDILQDLYNRRNLTELPAAVNSVADMIAPSQSSVLGARDLQKGAQTVIERLNAARTAAASPHYETAFNSGVTPDVKPLVSYLQNRIFSGDLSSTTRGVLKDALDELTTKKTVPGGAPGGMSALTGVPGKQTATVPVTNYRALHAAKIEIDSALDRLANKRTPPAIINAAKYELTPIQQQLTQILRNAHPEYEQGYQAYIANSAPLDTAKKSLVGQLAQEGMKPETVTGLIRGAKANDVAYARGVYRLFGQGDEWDAGVRAMLDQSANKAMTRTQSGQVVNAPGKFQADIAGSPDQDQMLRAAVPPGPAADRLNNLVSAARNTAGTLAEGSSTSADTLAKDRLASPVAKVAGKLFHGLDPFEIGPMVGDWILHKSAQRNAEKLATRYAGERPLNVLGDLANTYVPVTNIGRIVLGLLGQSALHSGVRGLGIGNPSPLTPRPDEH